MEFKNKNVNRKKDFNKYDGRSNPPVWRPKFIDWDSMSFEEKMAYFLNNSREKLRDYCDKQEFMSNREEKLLDEKIRVKREANQRKWNREE